MKADIVFGLSPLLIVAVGALVLAVTETLHRLGNKRHDSSSARLIAPIVLFAAAGAATSVWQYGLENLPGVAWLAPYILIDRFGLLVFVILALAGALCSLLAGGYLPEHGHNCTTFYPLLLLSTASAMLLTAASDMRTMLTGLVAVPVCVQGLSRFRRTARAVTVARNAAVSGACAAALLAIGGLLLYQATGRTDMSGIASRLTEGNARPELVVVALVLIVVGLAYRASAAPFHLWTPETLDTAPMPVTAYVTVVVRTSAIAMMWRVLPVAFSDTNSTSWGTGWPPVVATLAIVSMTVGNLVALRQESIKRMLVYGSIAHVGYLLIAVTVASKSQVEAETSIVYCLLAYAVSTVGAFGVLALCGSRGSELVRYSDLAGLGRRAPVLAFVFSIFLLSLAGLPPLAGFFARVSLFLVAIGNGYMVLSAFGLLNSVIGAYYSLRVIACMYGKEAETRGGRTMRSRYVAAAVMAAAVITVLLGAFPGRVFDVAHLATNTP